MHHLQGKRPGLDALRYGLLLAVSMVTLSGCVSAVSTDMRADSAISPAGASEDIAEGDGSEDPAVAEASDTAAADPDITADGAGQPEEEQPTDMAGLVMQPTSLNAGKTSIYSAGGENAAVPAHTTQSSGTNAALTSIYSNGNAAQAGGDGGTRLPLEDMPVPDLSSQQALPLADEEAAALPANIPIPKTARTALVAEQATGNAADKALTPETVEQDAGTAVAERPAAEGTAEGNQATDGRKKMTLASLFGAKRQTNAQFDGERFAEKPRRVINRDSVGTTRRASLGIDPLPGVVTGKAMFATATDPDEEEDVEDEGPRFKEVASLAGLARLAPNGLWLQTEKVRTGCFKPELLNVLKTVEKHYGKPIIVTSGLRQAKRNRARQSLHTRCEAADIQIAGVSKWELADYLRSMPGRGGVGTYCHTESVHIDIGPERDWNWRCRRRK